MKVHTQLVGDGPSLVDAARSRAVDIDLLQSDDVRLTGADDFRNARGGKPAVDAEAAVNVICQDPRHLFPSLDLNSVLAVSIQCTSSRTMTAIFAASGNPAWHPVTGLHQTLPGVWLCVPSVAAIYVLRQKDEQIYPLWYKFS